VEALPQVIGQLPNGQPVLCFDLSNSVSFLFVLQRGICPVLSFQAERLGYL
jgi:hypothetical protein